jgi:hypothetical protein
MKMGADISLEAPKESRIKDYDSWPPLSKLNLCSSKIQKSYPASDLIIILRIIWTLREFRFRQIKINLEFNKDPLDLQIVLVADYGESSGVLRKDLLEQFKEMIFKSKDPLLKLMLASIEIHKPGPKKIKNIIIPSTPVSEYSGEDILGYPEEDILGYPEEETSQIHTPKIPKEAIKVPDLYLSEDYFRYPSPNVSPREPSKTWKPLSVKERVIGSPIELFHKGPEIEYEDLRHFETSVQTFLSCEKAYTDYDAAKNFFKYEKVVSYQRKRGDIKETENRNYTSTLKENIHQNSPYKIGLTCRTGTNSILIATLFAARATSDPLTEEVMVMSEKEHLKSPLIYPRVILIPKIIENFPIQQYIESLHLLMKDADFEQILDTSLCWDQPEGWATMAMIMGPHENAFSECVFSLSCFAGVWGPNNSFPWEQHPFSKLKEKIVMKSRNKARLEKEFEDILPQRLGELLIARLDHSRKGYVLDYGFFTANFGINKMVLHPLALKLLKELPKEPIEGVIHIKETDEIQSIKNFIIKETFFIDDYYDMLYRYGLLENSTYHVKYH